MDGQRQSECINFEDFNVRSVGLKVEKLETVKDHYTVYGI
jgi:hypothetical protein